MAPLEQGKCRTPCMRCRRGKERTAAIRGWRGSHSSRGGPQPSLHRGFYLCCQTVPRRQWYFVGFLNFVRGASRGCKNATQGNSPVERGGLCNTEPSKRGLRDPRPRRKREGHARRPHRPLRLPAQGALTPRETPDCITSLIPHTVLNAQCVRGAGPVGGQGWRGTQFCLLHHERARDRAKGGMLGVLP